MWDVSQDDIISLRPSHFIVRTDQGNHYHCKLQRNGNQWKITSIQKED